MEDERAIERVIASSGPLVDAGEADATAGLWAVDGGYDVEDAHQGMIARGCSHYLGPAVVTVDGEDAVAHPTTRALDGNADARSLLSAGVAGRTR